MPLEAQVMRKLIAELHPGVIRRDRDPHEYDSPLSSASSSSALVIAPARSTVSGSVVQSTIVELWPTGVGPPSRMIATRPSSCSRTCCAVVVSGWPDRVAPGAG